MGKKHLKIASQNFAYYFSNEMVFYRMRLSMIDRVEQGKLDYLLLTRERDMPMGDMCQGDWGIEHRITYGSHSKYQHIMHRAF